MLRRRRSSGQAMVEFALLLPVLVIMFLGLTDFGLFFFAQVQVTNAAREGARAGSLFRAQRFNYTSCYSNCEVGYGDGGSTPDCWSPVDWVENALVERNRMANGCDALGFKINPVHAFGLLNPAKCASATSGTDCWWLQPLVFTADGEGLPTAGDPIRVTVRYRYSMLLVSSLIPMFPDTMVIDRTVIMKAQTS